MKLTKYDSRDWRESSGLYKFLYATQRHAQAAMTRVRFKGLENVPRSGGVILAVNHYSWWDPIVMDAIMPRQVVWLAKREIFRGPFTNWFFRSVGVIPVDRRSKNNESALREALDALARERVVGIFPEGTRAPPGDHLAPKPGVARLAFLSGCPVLPVGIASDRFWPRGRNVPRLGEKVHVVVGEPVRYDYGRECAGEREIEAKVAEDVMARIRVLAAEARAARDAERP